MRLLFKLGCLLGLIGAAAGSAQAQAQPQTVVGGAGNDYQVSVQIPAAAPALRIAVFERLDGSFSGDLWVTHSLDAGVSWSDPSVAVASAANERHPSLVEGSEGGWLLFHLSSASGGFRIHRATSEDGLQFVARGAIDLGWPSGGEINPQVMRLQDGRLLLAYHRIGGAAFVAVSSDEGLSWDTTRTQVSLGNAALPRIAQRPSDGRLLLVYQTNPGDNQLRLLTRSSLDPLSWQDTPQAFASTGNNHDAWPLWVANEWQLFWTRVDGGSFQLHRGHSTDGLAWSQPEQPFPRPGLANVQPMVLVSGAGIELHWGAAQVVGDSNYDIVRMLLPLPDPHIFLDGFEAVTGDQGSIPFNSSQ